MPGPVSTHSSGSEHSDETYHSVGLDGSETIDITHAHVQGPELFSSAVGVYDQTGRQFYAVDITNHQVAHWHGKQGWQWLSENKGRLATALLDLAPTLVQGGAAFATGRVNQWMSFAGVVTQAGVGINELRQQIQKYREGASLDPVQLCTSAARIAAAAMNGYAAGTDQEVRSTRMVGGAANWLAGGATLTDVVHHAHTDPVRQPDDPGHELQMYPGQHRNPAIENTPMFNAGYVDPWESPNLSQELQPHPQSDSYTGAPADRRSSQQTPIPGQPGVPSHIPRRSRSHEGPSGPAAVETAHHHRARYRSRRTGGRG